MGYLAPAGTVMSLANVASGWTRGLISRDARNDLAHELQRFARARRCWPISSGRAALTLILKSMRAAAGSADRNEVIIPAYTCYSVAASVQLAGLRPRLCDVDPATFSIDPTALEQCDFSRVLAVVSTSLYGLPGPLRAIEDIARRHGIFMVDDSAQSLGARLDEQPVGSFGDAGLYSFDKGKIICAIQGGAIVTRNPQVESAIDAVVSGLPKPTFADLASNALKLPVYTVFLRPSLYGAIRQLPFLGLGKTAYETRYPVSHLSALQSGVALDSLQRLEVLNAVRRKNAARLADALRGIPGIEVPSPLPGALPVFARFPIRVLEPGKRDDVIRAFDMAGIGATGSYPSALVDVPEVAAMLSPGIGDFPRARAIAREIVTLPTHGYCPADLGDRVRSVLTGCLPSAATQR